MLFLVKMIEFGSFLGQNGASGQNLGKKNYWTNFPKFCQNDPILTIFTKNDLFWPNLLGGGTNRLFFANQNEYLFFRIFFWCKERISKRFLMKINIWLVHGGPKFWIWSKLANFGQKFGKIPFFPFKIKQYIK